MTARSYLACLAVAAFVSLAACSENGSAGNGTATNEPTDTKLAAYAAQVTYPSNLKTEMSTTMGTVVDSDEKSLRVLNFGDNPVNDADLWINNSYVYKVDSIPSRGHVKLNLNDFYDNSGHSFGQQSGTVSSVQLHLGDRVYTLLGPVVNNH